jgi:hypothetical protein
VRQPALRRPRRDLHRIEQPRDGARVPPPIAREIVGPSDIEVTMTIYAHASLNEKRAARRKLGDALG